MNKTYTYIYISILYTSPTSSDYSDSVLEILPTQTMHILKREIPQNYHIFALFDPPSRVIPVMRTHFSAFCRFSAPAETMPLITTCTCWDWWISKQLSLMLDQFSHEFILQIPYAYHPCMVYISNIFHKKSPIHVAKYTIHGWIGYLLGLA